MEKEISDYQFTGITSNFDLEYKNDISRILIEISIDYKNNRIKQERFLTIIDIDKKTLKPTVYEIY